MPLGRVNERNPLGHSGQRKLQLVVGSNEIAIGMPQGIGFRVILLIKKPEYTLKAFQILRNVSFSSILRLSCKWKAGIEQR